MPKNKGKGGKNRRRGKNENDDVKRELMLKDDGQSYAQVTRILGNGHIEAFCFDNTGGKTRLCRIRGKLRKKQWINQGDVILVGLRDYQDDKADVIMKYHADEARELKRIHEIPDNIETSMYDDDESKNIVFDDRYNSADQSTDEEELPRNVNGRAAVDNSHSEDDSDNDNEDDSTNFYQPNRMPKQIENLNTHNSLRNKKKIKKYTRDNGKEAIPEWG
ncbi:unnamed protein product [Rotaria sordida]|uniref:S1-like domain-containing protein n=2 Tax=Rotaria sordida TaxID=392033 RepID=A0A819L7U0_9BILA|nr:unnamed protein product [Rotaria sordida]CAF3956733.1 unnamed protein product [Rotaria sordida]CAF4020091.1 unnamed protein product [Rotaria sordida]